MEGRQRDSKSYGMDVPLLLTPLQEPCQTSRGLQSFLGFQSKASAFIGLANPVYCDAASMLSKGWNKVGLPLSVSPSLPFTFN